MRKFSFLSFSVGVIATLYLLAGDEAGSKLVKAKSLNIPVLDWDMLLSMLH